MLFFTTIFSNQRFKYHRKNTLYNCRPNGAGKTTAAYTFLPEMLECKIYLNADEIAKQISPLDVNSAAFEAGRIMLQRIESNLVEENTFSIESTLSTRYYIQLVNEVQKRGYKVLILFLYLKNSKIAKARVKKRVELGGHDIPLEVIQRRYERGLFNFFNYFKNSANNWYFIDNENDTRLLASKTDLGIDGDNEIFCNLVKLYEKK